MKKIIALVLALAMILMVGAVYAENADDAANKTDGVWRGSKDTTLTIGGLDKGDVVKLYQVLEYDQNSVETHSWKATEKFNSLTAEQIKAITETGITEALAGTIGKLATGDATYTLDPAGESGTVTKTDPAAGLYVAIITPAIAGTMYNPVFVGADYYTNDSGVWSITADMSYSSASMAKKTKIELDKKADLQTNNKDEKVETVGVGDEVSFIVKTTIPEFADNYTKAVFKVSDVLSSGLKLMPDTLSIAYAADSEEAMPTGAYDTPTTSDSGFTVNFKTDYLLGLTAATPIQITYKALVTSAAVTSVNIEDNTVTVNFSNHPDDGEGKGVLKDETKHYTFDIDGDLLGDTTWRTVEVAKVGLDKDGNEIKDVVAVHEGREIGALEGATFALYTDSDCTTRYSNDYYKTSDVIVSDATGRLTIKGSNVHGIRGLDAGTYYLQELTAPAGYIRDQRKIPIVITATTKTVHHEDTINGIKVEWDVEELDSYTITIDGDTTATYSMTNEKPNKGDTVIDKGNPDGKINNTQGTELPSTGGIGTTIFYILGGLLVVGAAVILVARRKAQD